MSNTSKNTVAVLGAGSFGKAMARLLSKNREVVIYARREAAIEQLREEGFIKDNIAGSTDLERVISQNKLLIITVPSSSMRSLMQEAKAFIEPDHLIIHGTKGFDVNAEIDSSDLKIEDVYTMSEVIKMETSARRVGCLAGPNLASEIISGFPAATVIASPFAEVIREGQLALRSNNFQVFGNEELRGIELSGILKNVYAIASGILVGLGYGDNAKALLITRGWGEMIHVGKILGGDLKAFLGLAGIGDLVVTCSSKLSRNFRTGFALAQNKKLHEVVEEIGEVVEGVKTIQIVNALGKNMGFRAPITEMLYKTLFEDYDIKEGVEYLMNLRIGIDVDFLD